MSPRTKGSSLICHARVSDPEDYDARGTRRCTDAFGSGETYGDAETSLGALRVPSQERGPGEKGSRCGTRLSHVAIYHGVHVAFFDRAQDSLVKCREGTTRHAVFDDVTGHGTPRSQLTTVGQPISGRRTEYHAASAHAGSSSARL